MNGNALCNDLGIEIPVMFTDTILLPALTTSERLPTNPWV